RSCVAELGRRRGSAVQTEVLLESLAACSTDTQANAILQLHLVVAAFAAQEDVNERDAHDRRAMAAHEHFWIESFFERLHRFTHDVAAVADMQLRVYAGGDDVVDVGDGNDSHLPF